MATVMVAYAITSLFFTKSQTSELSKKQIFQFDLNGQTIEIEWYCNYSTLMIGNAHFWFTNDATEEMYVFVKIQMPTTENGVLYTFEAGEEWTLVESGNGTVVYAYGITEMTVLSPGDSTSALTNQMTMKSISNAEYAAVDDINITITGYAIGVEGVATNPMEEWNQCKVIGNIE